MNSTVADFGPILFMSDYKRKMMFKDLFLTIAAGVIGVLPVAPAPAVVVTTANVEASVVDYIENHEHRLVTVDCNIEGNELSIHEGTPQNFVCITVDKENKEKFQTKITVSSTAEKISVTASVDKSTPFSAPTSSPSASPSASPTAPTPVPTEAK